jgi:hypothetical protein
MVHKKNQHWHWDVVVVSNIVVEATDVEEEVVGVHDEDEASSSMQRSPNALSPLPYTGS